MTGPLLADGRVDYIAALNSRLRQGVTPANNANVLFWKAFGPRPEGGTMPPEFFEWMGIEAPPERGDYYIDEFRYLPFVPADALIEPKTGAELIPVLFRRELDTHQLGFAIGETLAHLNFLEAEGRAVRELGADGIERFHKP